MVAVHGHRGGRSGPSPLFFYLLVQIIFLDNEEPEQQRETADDRTINDDLHDCGLVSDDEECMAVDVKALCGNSSAPNEVGGDSEAMPDSNDPSDPEDITCVVRQTWLKSYLLDDGVDANRAGKSIPSATVFVVDIDDNSIVADIFDGDDEEATDTEDNAGMPARPTTMKKMATSAVTVGRACANNDEQART
ncbi:hypothetical protein ACP70R_045723 [Stipagrostis hirtigluma subsp. patula]